jgi:hypothetical protein
VGSLFVPTAFKEYNFNIIYRESNTGERRRKAYLGYNV